MTEQTHIIDAKAKAVAGNIRTIVRLWNSPTFKEFGGRKLLLKEIGLTKPFFEANVFIDKIMDVASVNPSINLELDKIQDEIDIWRDSIFSKKNSKPESIL